MGRQEERALPLLRGLAVAAGVATLMAACTGGRPSDGPSPSTSPASPVTTQTPVPETTDPQPIEPIEFAFQAPDPVCPPASALQTLPLAAEHRYVSVDPLLVEHDNRFATICDYKPAEIDESEDMILQDHATVFAQVDLYRRWEDSDSSRVYPELPVGSRDIEDWNVGIRWSGARVRWEGCGPATSCQEGEEPTVRTYARRADFSNHAGNLEFNVRVTYVAERLPTDVDSRIVAIFRDLVLAVLESYERVEPATAD